MNRSNTLALFMGCCLLGHAKAQSPMHLVIDTTTTQILPLVCGAAMSDGGDALLLQSQTGLVVLRCDPMGAPQWRNKYATGAT
ncbi:MAG: hypothetical protein IT229_12425 [Flavobacteriales bacterium]|nr:hypothetical protein [Flavobacteriales bacterium]